MKTYVGDDGKLHFVNSAGADTVLPFSNNLLYDDFSITEIYNTFITGTTANMQTQTYTCTNDGIFIFSFGFSDQGNGGTYNVTLDGIQQHPVRVVGSTPTGSNYYSSDGVYIFNVKTGSVVTFGASTNSVDGVRNLFCAAYFCNVQKLETSFHEGYESIYNALVSKGLTPASKTLDAIVTTINEMAVGGRTLQLNVNLVDYAKYPQANVVIKDTSDGKTMCSFGPVWTTDANGNNTHSAGRNTSVQSKTFVV